MNGFGLKEILDKVEREVSCTLSEKYFYDHFPYHFSESSSSLKSHLLTPLLDIASRGGKRIRPVLLILITRLLLGNEDAAYTYCPVIEAVHTASLIHDDIEDGSLKRRGYDSLHIKYGLDTALNAASWFYFFALSLIEKQERNLRNALYAETVSALTLLHLGQAMDIKHHSNYDLFFNYDMYTACVALKTGTLFSLVAKVACIFSQKELKEREEPTLFSELGVVFQMLDDLQNISSGNKGKDRGDDIVEGKLSFPVILYLEERNNEKAKIISLFDQAKKEGASSSAVRECCTLLEKSGVLEKGAEIAQKKMAIVFDRLYNLHRHSSTVDVIKEFFLRSTPFITSI